MRTGLIESKRRRATGHVVSVYHAESSNFDPHGGPYVTVCEEHSTICNHETLSLALSHAPRAEWCEECQEPPTGDKEIIGYEFELDFDGRTEWMQLHGSGGALGAAALHVQDPAKIGPVCLSLRRRARSELRRWGTVRRTNACRKHEKLNIENVYPTAVLDCRPIYQEN